MVKLFASSKSKKKNLPDTSLILQATAELISLSEITSSRNNFEWTAHYNYLELLSMIETEKIKLDFWSVMAERYRLVLTYSTTVSNTVCFDTEKCCKDCGCERCTINSLRIEIASVWIEASITMKETLIRKIEKFCSLLQHHCLFEHSWNLNASLY